MRIALPEQVWLDLKVAGFGSRALAYIIDFSLRWIFLLILILTLLVLYSFIESTDTILPAALESLFSDEEVESSSSTHLLALIIVFIFIVEWSYPVYFEVYRQGMTPGKKSLGLRVVDEAGLPLTFQASALRTLLLIVDMLPACGFVALISMLVTKKSQRLGDIVAKTIVVYDIEHDMVKELPVTSASVADRPILLPIKHYNLLERYLQRKNELAVDPRSRAEGDLLKILLPLVEQSGVMLDEQEISGSALLEWIFARSRPRKDF